MFNHLLGYPPILPKRYEASTLLNKYHFRLSEIIHYEFHSRSALVLAFSLARATPPFY